MVFIAIEACSQKPTATTASQLGYAYSFTATTYSIQHRVAQLTALQL
jgi:hypothetical protein